MFPPRGAGDERPLEFDAGDGAPVKFESSSPFLFRPFPFCPLRPPCKLGLAALPIKTGTCAEDVSCLSSASVLPGIGCECDSAVSTGRLYGVFVSLDDYSRGVVGVGAVACDCGAVVKAHRNQLI